MSGMFDGAGHARLGIQMQRRPEHRQVGKTMIKVEGRRWIDRVQLASYTGAACQGAKPAKPNLRNFRIQREHVNRKP